MPITEEQRQELTRWAQSRTLPAGDVFRARLILALAESQSYRQIMSSLGQRRLRFRVGSNVSRTRVADAALQARIARKNQRKPVDGLHIGPAARWQQHWV